MTEPIDRMLDLAFFRTGTLTDVPPGCLFVPASENGQHLVGGRLNDMPVLVGLEGDNPFLVAAPEQWPPSQGLIVRRIRFQIDKASAVEIRHAQDAPRGALVLSPLGAMIVAYDDNGPKAVLLEGGSGSTGIENIDSVAFTLWQIVAEHEAEVVMYRPPRISN